jgi:hypothetical protein
MFSSSKAGGQIDGSGGLPNSTFLIGNSDDPGQMILPSQPT